MWAQPKACATRHGPEFGTALLRQCGSVCGVETTIRGPSPVGFVLEIRARFNDWEMDQGGEVDLDI